jgi:LmbE family N-acetylglucosaminyl deacetylase
VVFGTDGDRNPWPQRFLERRWRVADSDRARWGRRRRQEAREALRTLGGDRVTVRFLQFPDQGLTRLMLAGGKPVLEALRAEFVAIHPTVLAMPSASDRHPDHSAMHILARFAYGAALANVAQVLEYTVHPPRHAPAQIAADLTLSPAEVELKRAAILRHETQIALSRRRFLGYAQPVEEFMLGIAASEESAEHPVCHASWDGNILGLTVKASATVCGGRLFLALQSKSAGPQRWSLELPAGDCVGHLQDEITGRIGGLATLRRYPDAHEVRIRLPDIHPLVCGFVKLEKPHVFFDSFGWRELPPTPLAKASVAFPQVAPMLA